jgi:chitinase
MSLSIQHYPLTLYSSPPLPVSPNEIQTDKSQLSDEWVDAQMPVDGSTGCLGSFMRLKSQHPYLKLILSIGGGGASQNFVAIAASAATRDNFGRSAKGLVDASGFDGIDIDWEHPQNPQEGSNFLALLAAIRLHLPPTQYLLTAALPAGEWCLQNIDLRAASSYLDLLNLMAYDFHGSWSSSSGHHAQLFPSSPNEPSGSAAVDYVISTGFPASKVLLGVPVYGRSWVQMAPVKTLMGMLEKMEHSNTRYYQERGRKKS